EVSRLPFASPAERIEEGAAVVLRVVVAGSCRRACVERDAMPALRAAEHEDARRAEDAPKVASSADGTGARGIGRPCFRVRGRGRQGLERAGSFGTSSTTA